jgi:hypothetical protein
MLPIGQRGSAAELLGIGEQRSPARVVDGGGLEGAATTHGDPAQANFGAGREATVARTPCRVPVPAARPQACGVQIGVQFEQKWRLPRRMRMALASHGSTRRTPRDPAHNPKVAGSNPAPAMWKALQMRGFSLVAGSVRLGARKARSGVASG